MTAVDKARNGRRTGGSAVVGVSLRPEVLSRLDRLAQGDGVARSALVARLVEAEVRRRSGKVGLPEVVVDGVPYRPARGGR